MTERAMKTILFVGALAAAAGLTSCTDISYSEFESESTDEAPAAVASAPDETTSLTENISRPDASAPDVPDSVTVLDGIDSSSETVTEVTAEVTEEITEESPQTDASSEEPGGGGDGSFEITPQYVAFCGIIEEYRSHFGAGTDLNSEFCRYYITDIDGDGVYELIAETGTFEADRTAYVFVFDGEHAILCGDFITWHAEIGGGNGCLYSETQAMGSNIFYKVKLENGTVTTERADDSITEMPVGLLDYHTYDDLSGLDVLLEKPPASGLDIYN